MLNVSKYVLAPEQFVRRTLARYTVADDGCWHYAGSTTRDGYAQANYRLDGQQFSVYPHVLAYMVSNGPLIQGMQIDHGCHDPEQCIEPCLHRRCLNPAHLVQMPERQNGRRSGSPAGLNARRTHCPRGHEYDVTEAAGNRRCSTCRATDKARQNARHGAKYDARRAEKMRSDPEYRERRLAAKREYSRAQAERRRLRYATDAEYREKIKARARAAYERKKVEVS